MAGKKVNPVQLGPDNIKIIAGVTGASQLIPWAWGANASKLGVSDNFSRSSPDLVVGNHSFINLESGDQHTIGCKTDGTAWAWGVATSGCLGTNDLANRSSPTSVVGNHSFILVSARNDNTTHALKADGSAWGWGENNNGYLGIGTSPNDRSSPVSVVGNHSFIQIQSGHLARKVDGTVWAWGSGYPGDMTGNTRSSPISVVGNHSFIAIAANHNIRTGLKADGSVWSWSGYNNKGQLGDGTTEGRSSPTSVIGDHSFIQVAINEPHHIGRKIDGTIWAWGYNNYGLLGVGDTNNRSSPTSVIGNHSFIFVAGGSRSFAIKADGSIWAWGYNTDRGIGDYTNQSKSSPVSVVGNHSFSFVTAGYSNFAIAAKATTPLPAIAQELNNDNLYDVITNEGSTNKLIIGLPNAAAGITYDFYCAETIGIRIIAQAGHTIRIEGSESASGGYAESTTIGSFLTLRAVNSTEWVATVKVGTWSVT